MSSSQIVSIVAVQEVAPKKKQKRNTFKQLEPLNYPRMLARLVRRPSEQQRHEVLRYLQRGMRPSAAAKIGAITAHCVDLAIKGSDRAWLRAGRNKRLMTKHTATGLRPLFRTDAAYEAAKVFAAAAVARYDASIADDGLTDEQAEAEAKAASDNDDDAQPAEAEAEAEEE